MTESLKDYLAGRGAKPLEPEILSAHVRAMTGTVIPGIVEDVKLREQMAAQARFSPPATKGRRR